MLKIHHQIGLVINHMTDLGTLYALIMMGNGPFPTIQIFKLGDLRTLAIKQMIDDQSCNQTDSP